MLLSALSLTFLSNMKFSQLLIILAGMFMWIFTFSTLNAADCAPQWQTETIIDFLEGCAGDEVVGSEIWNGTDGVKELVKNVAGKALTFAALFAVGAIVWSGIRYTTSYGDDEKVKKAKSTAIYALIWLILALTAFSLVDILVTFVYSFY